MLSLELGVGALDAAGHMALDEAVLMNAPEGALVLRAYRWSETACTFGVSQSYDVAQAACDERGIKSAPVRRATGGGIVFHDGDFTFSLVFPWDRTQAPEAIYKNIHRGIHVALKGFGEATRLWSPERRAPGIAVNCFARPETMDLVSEKGTKVLGGALRKRQNVGLYQGSFRPEEMLVTPTVLESLVAQGIAREFGRAPATEIAPEWRDAGLALEEKYRSAEWNRRR